MNGYVYVRSICPQRPLRRLSPYGKHLGHGVLHRVHRNFTSAGYSASSVEKYHYHSDCHRRIRCSLTLLPGVLARSVSEVLAYPIRWLIIRTKVRCAYIFSCQGTVKELLLIGVKNNPFTCSDWERSNYRVFLKNSLKNFFELGK